MEQKLSFSAKHREDFLRVARTNTFDLLVIGGGITGAGIALDAVTRGLSVCLIEKGDFASGTSSKSTKLIHGGLRYLKQFEFGLVKEVGIERAILHHLAPHLVLPEKMLLPIIKGGSLGKVMTSIGLYIYDFLADVEGEDKRRMLDIEEVQALEPLLPSEKLLGGSLYAEYRTDDARLTIEVLKTAHHHGAIVISRAKATAPIVVDGKIEGMQCEDCWTGEAFQIRAHCIVNATGPWVDDVRRMEGAIQGKHLYLTKGSHIVVPHHRLPCRQAVYFDVPNDKRMIFAIPRLGVTYIGTTDTYYEADKDNIQVTREDSEYLLNAVNMTFPRARLSLNDIISSWSGLRPLIYEDGKSASEISRKDEIFESDSGLISIAGGKLTGYRKMSEKVVDLVAKRLKRETAQKMRSCQTQNVRISLSQYQRYSDVIIDIEKLAEQLKSLRNARLNATYLIHNYGQDAWNIFEQAVQSSYGLEKGLLQAEIDYCYEHEMILTPDDFIVRRSGRLYFRPDTIDAVESLIFAYFKGLNSTPGEKLQAMRETWDKAVDEALTLV